MPHHDWEQGRGWVQTFSLLGCVGGISWVKFSDNPGKQTFPTSQEEAYPDLAGKIWRFVPGKEVRSNIPEISFRKMSFKCRVQTLVQHHLRLE